MSARRPGRAATALLAALLALTGCGGGGSPDDEPTDGPVTASEATEPQSSGAPSGAAASGGEVAPCPAVESAPEVPNGLPALSLDCLGEGPATRLSALRGPMVLNVWASWCKPCAEEAPYLNAARKALGSRVAFLGIDFADAEKPALEWLSAMGVEYPSLADPDGKVRSKLRIPGPPATLFILPDGTIADVHYGAFTSTPELARAVDTHLKVSS